MDDRKRLLCMNGVSHCSEYEATLGYNECPSRMPDVPRRLP
jgi:hypothetical protein